MTYCIAAGLEIRKLYIISGNILEHLSVHGFFCSYLSTGKCVNIFVHYKHAYTTGAAEISSHFYSEG